MAGIKMYEACNYSNSEYLDRYNELQKSKDEIICKISELHKNLSDIKREEEKLNRMEVLNVLDYVRSYTRTGLLDSNEIDSLLCHCQNKLNGHLDSTFLTFKNPEEKTNETKD